MERTVFQLLTGRLLTVEGYAAVFILGLIIGISAAW